MESEKKMKPRRIKYWKSASRHLLVRNTWRVSKTLTEVFNLVTLSSLRPTAEDLDL